MFEKTPDEVWNSSSAQAIRQSIHDGSFRHCNKLKCLRFSLGDLPFASNVGKAAAASDASTKKRTDRLASIIEKKATLLDGGPVKLNLSFDRTCNLACPSCRTDFISAKSAERDVMLAMADEKIMPLLETAQLVTVTGSGDPFASKTFRHILRSIDPARCSGLMVQIVTNGVLFTPAEWERMSHLRGHIEKVNISIDAACPETYAIVRRGGDWDRLLSNIRFLTGLARQGAFKTINLTFVVQALNWREMPAFVRLGRELDVDLVYFSLLENWGTFSENAFAANAVHYPTHPDHQEFRDFLALSPELNDPLVLLGSSIPDLRAATRRAAIDM